MLWFDMYLNKLSLLIEFFPLFIEMPSTSNGEGSKQELAQKTCKNSDIEK